jgi:hypothetical protein
MNATSTPLSTAIPEGVRALAEPQNASEETGNRARYERSVGGFATVNRPCAASPLPTPSR